MPWQKESPVDTEDGLTKILADSVEFAFAWKWVLLSLLASMLIIGKAFTDRRDRKQTKHASL